MARIIKPENAGKNRTVLTKSIVVAIRELSRQTQLNPLARDIAAFIALALESISETIDETTLAWEKRGYWVKADRFRLDWDWCLILGQQMRSAILMNDWDQIRNTTMKIAIKLSHIQVSSHHRLGQPWIGAWEKINLSNKP